MTCCGEGCYRYLVLNRICEVSEEIKFNAAHICLLPRTAFRRILFVDTGDELTNIISDSKRR